MNKLRLNGGEDFISSAEIADRTGELGRYYTELYKGEPLVVITLLSGAVRFAIHLGEAIDNPSIHEEYYRTKKMQGVRSAGGVLLDGMLDINITDMNALVVEDIDHTRETLAAVGERFRGSHPKRLDLVCLLNNVGSPKLVDELPFDDVQYAFDIANRFVVGHGLDWNGLYRNQRHISAAHNIAEVGEPELWVPMVPDEFRVAA